VADLDEDYEFHWPCWRVGVDMEDLFGDLHERFNTAPMFIQDPESFHKDVCDVASHASSKEDFYERMQQRRDDRLDELKSFIKQIDLFAVSGFFPLEERHARPFRRIRRWASLDCLVAFFASFLGPNKRGQLPSMGKLFRLLCG
jgi:hypothetical protein